MYHGNEPAVDKKRPRKQPPNQVWLDAIMSKSRSAEPSPVNGAMAMRAMRATPPSSVGEGGQGAPPTWRQPSPSHYHHPPHHHQTTGPAYYPPMPPSSSSARTPSPSYQRASRTVNVEASAPYPHHHPEPTTVVVDSAALAGAMTKALKELVAEQECCFIARGICHLCGGNEKNLVPVINFCPAFSPTHSLCREHLRSMHRVRLEDIFAGKNQPTVSKKSLRCAVCALACPCSKCQLERDAEFAKFKHAFSLQLEKGEAPDSSRRSRDHTAVPAPERGDGLDNAMPRRRSREEAVGRHEPPPAEEKGQGRTRYEEEKPSEENVMEDDTSFDYEPQQADEDSGITETSMVADPKLPAPRPARFPKRAAKESVPPALDMTNLDNGRVGTGTEDEEGERASPSAGSVLNCPESERSLVDLLSSLNQRVTPAVRYFADADEPTLRDEVEPRPSVGRVDTADGDHAPEQDDETDSARQRKRKRDSIPTADDRSGSAREKVSPPKPRSDAAVDQDSSTSYRRKAPAPLATNEKKSKDVAPLSPSPRVMVLSSTRVKTAPPPPPEPKVNPRKREAPSAPAPSPPASTRKRKTEVSVPSAMDRMSPRDAAHRGHGKGRQSVHKEKKAKRSRRSSAESDEEVIKYTADDDDEDEELEEVPAEGEEESELDSNLDYCEVCLAAGDLVCCDVCPRSFHLSCLKMTEDDLPEGEWQCAECQKPSYFESFEVAVESKTTVQTKCLQIIKCLKSHPFAKPFLLPVEDVPDYAKIVKQPMDLSTLEKKLIDGKYLVNGKGTMQGASGVHTSLHLGSFAEDVRLVWANCKLYNDDGSGITRAADHLSEGFEKLYQGVLKFVERLATTKTPATIHPSGVSRHEEKKKAVVGSGDSAKTATDSQPRDGDAESDTSLSTSAHSSSSDKETKTARSQPQQPAKTNDSASPSPATSKESSAASSVNTSPTETTPKMRDQLSSADGKSPQKEGSAPAATTQDTSPSK